MKINAFKNLISAVIVLIVSGFFANANAQVSNDNLIQEVRLTKSDNFKPLKEYLFNNFDYTNVESLPGVYNSNIQFDIDQQGKVTNVHAKGDCKYVDLELEQTLKEMIGSIKGEPNVQKTTYVMPVTLVLEK